MTITLCFCHSRHVHPIPWLFLPAGPLLEAVTNDILFSLSVFLTGHAFHWDDHHLGAHTGNQHEFREFHVIKTMFLFGPSALPYHPYHSYLTAGVIRQWVYSNLPRF